MALGRLLRSQTRDTIHHNKIRSTIFRVNFFCRRSYSPVFAQHPSQGSRVVADTPNQETRVPWVLANLSMFCNRRELGKYALPTPFLPDVHAR
jgi:hypothetical protein